VLPTDASSVAAAATLTRPDDEGRQHPAAYERRELTVAERNHPAHVLELLAVVHLRADKQAITWLKTNRRLDTMYARWLD
jgi:hypothetical protein